VQVQSRYRGRELAEQVQGVKKTQRFRLCAGLQRCRGADMLHMCRGADMHTWRGALFS